MAWRERHETKLTRRDATRRYTAAAAESERASGHAERQQGQEGRERTARVSSLLPFLSSFKTPSAPFHSLLHSMSATTMHAGRKEGRKDVERAFILWFPAEWQICIVGQIPLAKSSDPFQRVERKPSDIRSGPELIRIPPARSAIEMDLRGKS